LSSNIWYQLVHNKLFKNKIITKVQFWFLTCAQVEINFPVGYMEESSTFIAVQCHGRGRDTTIEQIKMPEAFCSDLFVVVSNKFLEIVKPLRRVK
jgi:hypothetical protein